MRVAPSREHAHPAVFKHSGYATIDTVSVGLEWRGTGPRRDRRLVDQALEDKDFRSKGFRRVPEVVKRSTGGPSGAASRVTFSLKGVIARRLIHEVFSRSVVPSRKGTRPLVNSLRIFIRS